MKTTPTTQPRETQCKKPRGWLGRLVLRNMNARHSGVTDWGLAQISVEKHFTILDIGCGGGRTVSKLAAVATEGKVYGLDYSKASVEFASKTNRDLIKTGRVNILEGSVSQLPFEAATFDLIIAIETHFWWPNLLGDLREVFRVLKPGGSLAIIAEVYKGSSAANSKLLDEYLPKTGLNLLTADEHRDLLAQTGYTDVQVSVVPSKGWIFASGRKPDPRS
jgi:ubiquinone/menaquinone biosynthesis C-methylase UbiE